MAEFYVAIDDMKQEFLGDPSGLMRKKEIQNAHKVSRMVIYITMALNLLGMIFIWTARVYFLNLRLLKISSATANKYTAILIGYGALRIFILWLLRRHINIEDRKDSRITKYKIIMLIFFIFDISVLYLKIRLLVSRPVFYGGMAAYIIAWILFYYNINKFENLLFQKKKADQMEETYDLIYQQHKWNNI